MKSPTLEPSAKPLMEPLMEPPSLRTFYEDLHFRTSYETSCFRTLYENFPLRSLLMNLKWRKILDLESSPPPPSLLPAPVPFLKSIEKMEAQLLSLEWEITEEKLKKTREEVLALRELLKQKGRYDIDLKLYGRSFKPYD